MPCKHDDLPKSYTLWLALSSKKERRHYITRCPRCFLWVWKRIPRDKPDYWSPDPDFSFKARDEVLQADMEKAWYRNNHGVEVKDE